MGKLVALLLILVVIAGGAYLYMNQEDSNDAPVAKKENKDAVRVEEKYGFTSNNP